MCEAVDGRLPSRFLRKLHWTAQKSDFPLMKSQRGSVLSQPGGLLFENQPRLGHAAHWDCHELPPVGPELIQLGLHILGVRQHLHDHVLKSFWLLGLD